MTNRTGRGRWERVVAARAQARAALGRDPSEVDPIDGPPKKRTPPPALQGPVWVAHGPGVTALSIGEAASKLGMSRAELEAMIAAGKVKTLATGYTPFVPTSEIDRLSPT
jgi:hypothetical protein